MNKNILLILCLMFSLTLVSASGYGNGYGCQKSINLTDVTNESGKIMVHYQPRCVSADYVLFGLTITNNETIEGVTCQKINTTYQNNTYHTLIDCTYPEYNENLTFRISAYCSGCKIPNLFVIDTPKPVVNETNVTEEPVVTPTPIKKKSSGGSSSAVKCEEWSVCTNGKQTQQCERNIVKTRACESVEIITTENGSYVDVEDIDKVDVPEPNTNEPVVDRVTELSQPKYNWPIIVIVVSLIGILLLILWIKRN